MLAPPEGLTGFGTVMFVNDFAQYEAAMNHGLRTSEWLLVDHFTPEPHRPSLMFPLYVALGRLAGLFGTGWEPLGSGLNDDALALTVFDDGDGPALYAGGSFTSAGGVPASNVARWDGSQWSALGSGTNGQVQALCVFDDGSGPALHAGGAFTSAGGTSASQLARWDGTSW